MRQRVAVRFGKTLNAHFSSWSQAVYRRGGPACLKTCKTEPFCVGVVRQTQNINTKKENKLGSCTP